LDSATQCYNSQHCKTAALSHPAETRRRSAAAEQQLQHVLRTVAAKELRCPPLSSPQLQLPAVAAAGRWHAAAAGTGEAQPTIAAAAEQQQIRKGKGAAAPSRPPPQLSGPSLSYP